MATASTTVHYENMPLMIASPSMTSFRIVEAGTYWGDVTIFAPDEYAERLRRAVAAFNAEMQKPDEAPASALDRSPEERAAAEAGYMPVSEYVERNT